MKKKLKCFLVAKRYVLMPQIKCLIEKKQQRKKKQKEKNNHLKWKQLINDLGNLNKLNYTLLMMLLIDTCLLINVNSVCSYFYHVMHQQVCLKSQEQIWNILHRAL